MAVYVDDAREPLGPMLICHLVADTPAELRSMAKRLDISTHWIRHQGSGHEHLDLCLSKRRQAILCGAIEVTGSAVGAAAARVQTSAQRGLFAAPEK